MYGIPTRAHVPSSILARLAFSLCAVSGVAQAELFICAKTSAELQTALTDASDGGMNNGQDVSISIAQGTYKTGAATGNGPFHYSSTAATGALNLIGGNGLDCIGFATDPTLAVLDGNSATQVLNISNANAPVSVQFLTIQNGESTTAGGGLSVNANGGNAVTLTNNIIQKNHTTMQCGGFVAYANTTGQALFSLDSNLIIGNSADVDIGAGLTFVSAGKAVITHNTIFKNTTLAASGVGGLLVSGNYSIISANIFWQNTNFGLDLQDNAAYSYYLYYNDYGALGGTPTVSVGNMSVAPMFADAAADNFHLTSDSPLLGGATATQGSDVDPIDLEGNAIPGTGRVDMGAYEETAFKDGFDG
jgi:hypothetical protein